MSTSYESLTVYSVLLTTVDLLSDKKEARYELLKCEIFPQNQLNIHAGLHL